MPFPHHISFSQFTYERAIKWGDVFWYDFGSPRAEQHTTAEPHLAVVVNDTDITLPGLLLIIPLSGAEHRRAGYPFHVVIKQAECPKLDKDSIAKVDHIYCVPRKPGLPDQYHLTTLNKKLMIRIYEPLVDVLGFKYVMRSS